MATQPIKDGRKEKEGRVRSKRDYRERGILRQHMGARGTALETTDKAQEISLKETLILQLVKIKINSLSKMHL